MGELNEKSYCHTNSVSFNIVNNYYIFSSGGNPIFTITESKRRFSNDQDRFFYEKHKIFLYKEDFEKFSNALKGALEFIETGVYPEGYFDKEEKEEKVDDENVDKWFDDLEKQS